MTFTANMVRAYSAGWEDDHNKAMECRDCEDRVAAGIATYHFLDGAERRWRSDVFRGRAPYLPQEDLSYREFFSLWLNYTDWLLSNKVTCLERSFDVEGASELRSAAQSVHAKLEFWQPPRLSAAVGMRAVALTEAGAREWKDFLATAPPAPSTPAIPQVREISSEEMLARVKLR